MRTTILRSALSTSWALLVMCGPVSAQADVRIVQGEALAREMCAPCHAIGIADRSSHPAAPPFRSLGRRLQGLDQLLDRLRQGLTSGHPDMPTFLFTRDDARNLIAYLRSVQGRRAN
jgi:cytochrome c